ncbi:helix-turn-helix domain-containing protein [Cysteiniphilum litorale]|uniref:helix-turn-helix domain-containing protein n=1 Tax=Cysteiniphilum litorale TaxID=2056700 RepID=UPI003F884717
MSSAQQSEQREQKVVNPLHKTFSIILKRLMAERGITVNDLADATGILPNTIVQLTLARGNPKVQTLIPLSKFFHVSIGALVGEEKLITQNSASLKESTGKIDLKLEWQKKYFLQCVEVYDKVVREKNIPFIDTKTSVKAITEIYEFSMTKKLKTPDIIFAEWIVKQYF